MARLPSRQGDSDRRRPIRSAGMDQRPGAVPSSGGSGGDLENATDQVRSGARDRGAGGGGGHPVSSGCQQTEGTGRTHSCSRHRERAFPAATGKPRSTNTGNLPRTASDLRQSDKVELTCDLSLVVSAWHRQSSLSIYVCGGLCLWPIGHSSLAILNRLRLFESDKVELGGGRTLFTLDDQQLADLYAARRG
jgi:hypothetical protein